MSDIIYPNCERTIKVLYLYPFELRILGGKMRNSYYVGARDIIDIIEYFLDTSKDLEDFKKKFRKLKNVVIEQRIEEVKEMLLLC